MSRFLSRHTARRWVYPIAAFAALTLGACATNPDPELVPDEPVRIAPPEDPVKQGDCAEALRRTAAKTNAHVDRLPTPRAFNPSPLPIATMPDEVRRARYNSVKITVTVDTLGRADMSTFKVLRSTHPWLASSVKTAVAKWKFEPAILAGCKVPRQFEWGATSGKAPRA